MHPGIGCCGFLLIIAWMIYVGVTTANLLLIILAVVILVAAIVIGVKIT